jgi:hypothetical protein
MKLRTLLAAFATASLLVGGTMARAGESEDQAALLKALPGAKVSLQAGLQAAEAHGRPISAKFEVEDGKLQLSVYTDKAGKFSEVIVDHTSGRVAKAEAITEGDDLAAAKAQAGALAKVKESLKTATDQAEHEAAGYRAIGVAPEQGDKGTVAKVTLAKGTELKTVTVPVK